MPKTTFIEDTMKKLDAVTPVSKRQVLQRNISLSLAILLLSFTSSWLLSSYVYDIFSTLFILTSPVSIGSFWIGDTLIELVLVAVLLSSLAYILYRKTDWPLVRHQGTLLLLFISVVGFGGGFIATHASDEFLQTPDKVVSSFPHRQNRGREIQEQLRQKNIAFGKVTSINQSTEVLTLESELGAEEYSYSSQTLNIETIEVGDMIVLQFEPSSIGLAANHIVRINKAPNREPINGLRPPVVVRRLSY